ncbi:FAD-dependent oxidoreductase [Verticiella sediminum]|uniref:FAD-dependent oxidoreductase n=1 Tax=Verticiella sediminum TaxID=1247510 RepID=A0A556AVI6_9BURK|nr:FAD-dependent tricarballylate dehydrogenase TcuA [Verticiella sediminum]TSH96385.1 FAD-dependent oxidoreductase [Verticiella sediminum]
MLEQYSYDVLVMGHGIAGMSAAVAAMEGGARVAVLERASEEESGGCTRYTEAFLRMKSETELADDFDDAMAEVASANPDPGLIAGMDRSPEEWDSVIRAMPVTDTEYLATFSREAVPAIQWLKGHGVRFIPTMLPQITLSPMPMITPSGGGAAMLEALKAAAHRGGVHFHYETTGRKLIERDGVVCGVAAVRRGHRPAEFLAESVILASGGFEGSVEMLARYIGQGASGIRPVAKGAHYNRGEGIRMALEAGAAPAGDFGAYHSTPVDERSARAEAKVLIFPFGVVVNRLGLRFCDEGSGADYNSYDRLCWAIQKQPDSIGYAILDARIEDVPNYARAVLSDVAPIRADSVQALATQLRVPPGTLAATLEAFNASCPKGSFEPSRADGLATTGAVPPKSNWARPIDKPPFIAYPLIPSGIITFGGVKTNARAEVLNADGDAIPNLYAAGAMTGVYYRRYPAATSVLRGATFGRIAGMQAARRARAPGGPARS